MSLKSMELDGKIMGYYAEGLSIAAIAVRMGVPRGTVARRVWRLQQRGLLRNRKPRTGPTTTRTPDASMVPQLQADLLARRNELLAEVNAIYKVCEALAA